MEESSASAQFAAEQLEKMLLQEGDLKARLEKVSQGQMMVHVWGPGLLSSDSCQLWLLCIGDGE